MKSRRTVQPSTLLVIVLTLLLTSGCSPWWRSDQKREPAALAPLEQAITVHTLWRKSVGKLTTTGRSTLVPAISGATLFTADQQGVVEAHDALSGGRLWRRETGLRLTGGPGVGEGVVLVGSSDAHLVALDAQSGEERWRVRLSSEILSAPTAARGVVAAYSKDGRLHGRSVRDGRPLWAYDRPTPALTLSGGSAPQLFEGRVISGFANGRLAALDIVTGDLLWESAVSLPSGRSDLERMVDIKGDPVIINGVLFAVAYQGDVVAMAAESGTLFWRRPLSSHTGLDVNWRAIYLSDDQDQVWALEPRSGSAAWKNSDFGNRRITAPALLGDYLLVGDVEGYVHWLRQEDGRSVARVRIGRDPITARPLVYGKVAYILGDGGELAALTLDPPASVTAP